MFEDIATFAMQIDYHKLTVYLLVAVVPVDGHRSYAHATSA